MATLENNKPIIAEMQWRIAAIKVKLGGISWEVDEPHNAQTDLDAACDLYFPNLQREVDHISGEIHNQEEKTASSSPDLDESNLSKPSFSLPASEALFLDAMKCLNLLGKEYYPSLQYIL